MRERLSSPISPPAYARVATVATGLLALIVLTGAGVRLTRSGLGCPDWPKCFGRTLPPLNTYAVIEFSNRILSGFVAAGAFAAGFLAFRRRPFRRDLAILGVLLPVGVTGQAILGGLTVTHHLAPGFVMGHFGLSMLILVAAVALTWRARHEPGEREPSHDRVSVLAVRGLAGLGAVAIFAGTAATAAGPHAGGKPHQPIHRLDFKGRDTLNWAIHQHGRIAFALGLAAVATWFLLRRREADPALRRCVTIVCLLLAAQGAVGGIQYELKLPSELVWVHVGLATATWLTLLWSTAVAGSLAPASAAAWQTARASGAR